MNTTPSVASDKSALIERIISEGALGPAALARKAGGFRAGRPTHPATIGRWCQAGVKLADGRVVKLEHYTLNGRIMSSVPALIRFIAAQQVTAPEEAVGRTPADRRKASEAAAQELELAGC